MDERSRKPLILMSASTMTDEQKGPYYALFANYAACLQDAGALALAVPTLREGDAERLADMAEGFVITGGSAVDPALYGAERMPYCGVVREERDRLEAALLGAFMARRKPVFGICHGFQLINAVLGGTLYQDIPRELGEEHPDASVHGVRLEKNSLLGRLFPESIVVNSYHHQAVKTLAPCLRATAVTENGRIIEGFSHESLPVFGVQWHPERMSGKNRITGEGPDMGVLFRAFVDML